MKPNIKNRLAKRKRRIERRLDGARHDRGVPMLGSRGIRVEMSDRIQAIATGGIGLVHQLARQTGLIEAIDRRLHLLSNWAYMVMTSLAWNLKAWWALCLPEERRWREKHRVEKRRILRMEFRTFRDTFIRIPCQILRTGRKLVYRVLRYHANLPVFFRLATVLRC